MKRASVSGRGCVVYVYIYPDGQHVTLVKITATVTVTLPVFLLLSDNVSKQMQAMEELWVEKCNAGMMADATHANPHTQAHSLTCSCSLCGWALAVVITVIDGLEA